MKQALMLIARKGIPTVLVVIALAACSANPSDKNPSEAFRQYETIVRWSQWDAAANFIATEYQQEHPITRLQLDRLRLFKVTAYTVRSTGLMDEGMTALQTVEIKMFNQRQAVERTIINEQVWRYNPEIKQWQLHSGLPDPTKRK